MNQFTVLVAAQKHQAKSLSDIVLPQNGYHCALSIALCQWLIYMLPDRIALLEHTMEGCYEVHRAKFVLLQNET